MGEWKEHKLGDIFKVKHGFAFKGQFITENPHENILVTPGNFHIGGGFKSGKFKYYFSEDFPDEYILSGNDIIVTMTDLSKESDTLGYSAKIPVSNSNKYLHNQRVGLLQFFNPDFDKDFIYWLLRTRDYQGFIVGSASGSSIMHTSPSRIEEYSCLFPPLPEQKAIANVLSSLDDKINLLHHQNKTLEAMAETLFRQWFVEEAHEDWEEKRLEDFFPIITGKKDANFSTENGAYPFFTCSQSVLMAPDYSFDGNAILLAGNGDFNVKRYKGKFEAYQRTYVLIPYNEKYFDLLYTFIKYYLPDITGGHQGSVINFITKGMIADYKLFLPSDKEQTNKKLYCFSFIYDKVDFNQSQISTLEKLRDTLLPKLMSGEVKVDI